MTIDATEVCVVCGQDASPEHHEPFRSHGGTDEDRYALCRKCHEQRHRNEWRLLINGEFISSVRPDGTVRSERAIMVKEDSPDPRYWSDTKIVGMVGQGLGRIGQLLLQVGESCHEYWRRYHYQENWAEDLSARVAREWGPQPGYSSRNLRYLAEQYPYYKEHPEDWLLQRGQIARLIPGDPDPEEAIEVATMARLDGQPVAAVVDTLRERQGKEPPEMCVGHCDECGAEVKHRRKKERG